MFRSFRAGLAPLKGFLQSTPHQRVAQVDPAADCLHHVGRLNIPVAQTDVPTGQDRIDRGRHLARQDRWAELSAEIRTADQTRATAPDGAPVADLLAFGARSDVVLAVEHALSDGKAFAEYDVLAGISELEGVMQDHPGDPIIALIVALAHIDLAWAWRGTAQVSTLPPLNRARCAAHFDRAGAILSRWRPATADSPIMAAADCALLGGQPAGTQRVADRYERLIALDPYNPRHMRAMGCHLLPRWFGSYEELELRALRAAANTQSIWGAGGYAWVQFDAIAMDEIACARLDTDYFLQGLSDIVARRPDQQTVNLLASYCALTMQSGQCLNEQADLVRSRIADAAQWLIRDHLTELHPLIWAHAANGFNNSVRVQSPERYAARGHRAALHAISDLFRDELRDGTVVTFTPSGLQLNTP